MRDFLQRWWRVCVDHFEETFDVAKDRGQVSDTHLYNINAAWERNRIYDAKGNPWPFRDSL